MPICVVALAEKSMAVELTMKLRDSTTPLVKSILIEPSKQKELSPDEDPKEGSSNEGGEPLMLESKAMEQISLLNPKLAQKSRQQSMAIWLIPFGFISGLTFTQMTGLNTFSELGFSFLPEAVVGSLLGMGSGWLGSYVAAASVNSEDNEDIKSLRKLNEEGKWLLLLETPLEIDLPWQIVRGVNPTEVVRLRDL